MLHDYAILQKCTYIYYLLFLKDSFAEQKQVKYLLECIRQAKRGKQKEINPKDLLIDFSDVITSKLPVSNKLISKNCPLTKYLKNMVLLVLSNHEKIQIQLI